MEILKTTLLGLFFLEHLEQQWVAYLGYLLRKTQTNF